jgi:hypothetical protein
MQTNDVDKTERSGLTHPRPPPSAALATRECSMRGLDQTGTVSSGNPAEQTLIKRLHGQSSPWSGDYAKHIVISIHAIQLFEHWAQLGKQGSCSSLQVFWSLLDSLVPAELESVQGAPHGVGVAFDETIIYDVGGTSAPHQQARVCQMLLSSEIVRLGFRATKGSH